MQDSERYNPLSVPAEQAPISTAQQDGPTPELEPRPAAQPAPSPQPAPPPRPAQAAAPAARPVPIAVDDGYASVKVVLAGADGRPRQFFFPSRLRSGAIGINHLISQDYAPIYRTDTGETYTVVQEGPVEMTRFVRYHCSPINRVLVHHALQQAGLWDAKVALATSLPVGDFYQPDGDPRQELIDEKTASLAKPVTLRGAPGGQRPEIVESKVFPEGMAALMDQLIDDSYQLHANTAPIGVVDIGGQTTDFVLMLPSIRVDLGMTGSTRAGVLDIQERLSHALCREHKLDSLSGHVIENTLRTRELTLFGRTSPLNEALYREAVMPTAETIGRQCLHYFGQGAELSNILFVGGGAPALFEAVVSVTGYQNATLHDDPYFANARGMYKILMMNARGQR